MKVYKVVKNQNIFDVTIAIYGSIDGIFDLLVSNPELSFESDLQGSDELFWNEDFIVIDSIPRTLSNYGIVPVNGERSVYYKDIDKDLRCFIKVEESSSNTTLSIAGDGDMFVDWGDNSDIQKITLQPTIQTYTHYFNNVTDDRNVRIYGDFNIKVWDMSEINGIVLPTKPLVVDEVVIKQNYTVLDGLFLFKGTYSLKLTGMNIDDLSPIKDMSLSYLELVGVRYSSDDVLNDYLKYIAEHNNQRRDCMVVLDTVPSGEYKEPKRDIDGKYIIESGMEAIYVITHEPSWNESGSWIFNINGTIYKYENAIL